MIHVIVLKNNDQIMGFTVNGHADYDDYGKDIVCSAVSMLTQSAILGLSQYLKLELKGKVENGEIECILPEDIDDLIRIQADAILATMVIGLETIVKDYSKYIRIEKRRWNP